MAIRIVRLGSPRLPGEGIRVGTVRRPPRGVPKKDFASKNYYDVWLPMLAPSGRLVKTAHAGLEGPALRAFIRAYRAEMAQPDPSRLLGLLAMLSHGANFSVGCYCQDEGRCHRQSLRDLLLERGAAIR